MSHDMTPFERHRLDRSHYGEICSRCGYLRCLLCGVECHCPAEVKSLTRWTQNAMRHALRHEAEVEAASTEVRLNAGRTSLTVVMTATDGTVKMFRLTVEAI